MRVRIIVYNCCTQHNTAQNSSDDLPFYPPLLRWCRVQHKK